MKLARYKLDLLGVKEVRWDKVGTVKAGDYNFFYGKENEINQLRKGLFYVDDVNILGGSVPTVKGYAESLIVASKETGLEENDDKTKYMVISRDQTAGLSHSVRINNSSVER